MKYIYARLLYEPLYLHAPPGCATSQSHSPKSFGILHIRQRRRLCVHMNINI